MELDQLKSQFNAAESYQISKETLLGMLDVNRHPVLKRIRIQLFIESTAWIVFLGFYYNFFDGSDKPVVWNMALVVSVGLLLVHNLLGYQATNNPIQGDNLIDSLEKYRKKLRQFARMSITTRILAIVILFGYFLSGVQPFEQRHFISMGVFPVFIMAQGWLLGRIWSRRIRIITMNYLDLLKQY